MKRVDLAGLAVDPASGSPLVVLREQEEPHRLVPTFVGPAEATAIAAAVSGQVLPRPLTHDLMAALVQSLDGHLDAVVVSELSEGTFTATLALQARSGEQRLDTRPSDGIALAVRLGAPLFVSGEVLDVAGIVPPVAAAHEVDEREIDEAVEGFRSFLDGVDPDALVEGISGSAGSTEEGS